MGFRIPSAMMERAGLPVQMNRMQVFLSTASS
jgi:hypothetical protein